MKQIDQDPTGYKVQRHDGSWTQRINKPMCRWMAIGGIAFLAVIALTQPPTIAAMFACGMIGFFVGGLWVLSLRSTDW